jgi:predicted dehydrogenase
MRKDFRVLVIGAGSSGRRHIENLLSLGVKVSAFRYRSELNDELTARYGIKVFKSLDEALDSGQDAIVIANRTDQHMPVATTAAQRGIHLYIEKPLSNSLTGINELYRTIQDKALVVEVGCMMRFNPSLKLIKHFLEERVIGQVYFARACVGQYLPDWRPDQDYRQSYSAKLEHGGGVLFDLIHELDYLYWWFGHACDVSAFLDHVSDLEIETEDVVQILLRFESGIVVQVQMDYLSPFYRRACEIIGSKGMITWDYNSGEVTFRLRGESSPKIIKSDENDRNAMFVEHMNYFLNRIQSGGMPAVSIVDAIEILKIALAAHKSSINRRAIRPSEISA